MHAREEGKTGAPLMRVYRMLDRAWGPQGWWPARTPLEMIVGAILTQNAAWSNVEKALANLRRARALSLRAVHEAPLERLAAWIRPSGYFNVKARRLRAFTEMVYRDYGGSLRRLLREEPAGLREVLLAVPGIGPETADSILLYAAGHPWFVVDAYTRRVLRRHGWLDGRASYDESMQLDVFNLGEVLDGHMRRAEQVMATVRDLESARAAAREIGFVKRDLADLVYNASRLSPEGRIELGELAARHAAELERLTFEIDRSPVLAEVFGPDLEEMMGYLTVMASGQYEDVPVQ